MSQQQPTQDNQKGQYKCSQCGQPFETQNELKQHEGQRHARPEARQDKTIEPGQVRGNEPHKKRGAGTPGQ